MAKRDRSNEINKWITLHQLSLRERQEKQPKWDEIDNYFRGWQWDSEKDETTNSGRNIVTVNMTYSHVKVVVPSTFIRYPKIYFIPQSPAAIDACVLLEQVLNADMRRTKLKSVDKRILQDVVLYGTGFSKTTFEIEGDILQTDEEKRAVDSLMEQFHDTPLASAVEETIHVPKAAPRIVRISPRDIGFSVGATDFGDPGFISHHSRMRLSVAKKLYGKKDLQPTYRLNREFSTSVGRFVGYGAEEYLDMVDVYEIWDVENQIWLTIAEGYTDDYLVAPEDNPYSPIEHPFDKLTFTPLEDQMWGFSEIEPVLPQFDELNDSRSQMANHRKRYNRKYGALEGAFASEEEETKLESGDDGIVVKFRGNRPIDEQFKPIIDAQMPADVYKYEALIKDDIRLVGRVNPYRRGDNIGSGTATEANLSEAGAQLGDKDRVDELSEFILNQLEKIRVMRRNLTPGQEVIDVTGNPLDLERWQYWTKEDVDIESMMCVEIGSTQPDDDTSRQNKALLLYQQALANPTVNPQSAFSKLLEGFGERNQSSWFLPNEIIQMQMLIKALGAAKENKGISPLGLNGSEPGPTQTTETPAELRGRAAPINP